MSARECSKLVLHDLLIRRLSGADGIIPERTEMKTKWELDGRAFVQGRSFYHLRHHFHDLHSHRGHSPPKLRLCDPRSQTPLFAAAEARDWPELLSRDGHFGWWCRAHEVWPLLLTCPFSRCQYRYALLQKPHWLSPLELCAARKGDSLAGLLDAAALAALLQAKAKRWVDGGNNYVHVAVLEPASACCGGARVSLPGLLLRAWRGRQDLGGCWREVSRGFLVDSLWPNQFKADTAHKGQINKTNKQKEEEAKHL